MHPILFEIGRFPVYTYGVLLAAAYLLGLQFALVRARARGLDPNRVMDLGIWIIISALAGAKLLLLIVDFKTFGRSAADLLTLVRSAGVFYARSTDRGATFAEPVALGAAEFSAPAHVQLALGSDRTVVAVWDDGTVKTPKVVMRVSHDNGASFGPATLVSTEGRPATFPVLALTGKDLTIAWSEQSQSEHDHEMAMAPNLKDPKAVTMKNGKPATSGACPVCGTKMYRIGKG